MRYSVARAYDRLFSEQRKASLEHAMVYLSIAGYSVHLLLVFLSRTLSPAPAWVAVAGRNYLAALYTPFSFILFYEVLMLIWALPESTTASIAKQYEIVSLIFIRNVFKHIAEMQDVGKLEHISSDLIPVSLDMCGGLGMFLLVTLFKQIAGRRSRLDVLHEQSLALKEYISQKKGIAFVLTIVVVSMAFYGLLSAGLEGYQIFYSDLFSILIFTDVLILMLSMLVSDRYELVFRNAAFVVSTILIRYSLTIGPPYNAPIALFGMVFGILTLLVYNRHSHLRSEA